MEGARDLGRRSEEHVLGGLGLNLLIKHNDGQATIIFPTPTRSASHLDVLARQQDAVLQAVPLSSVCEHNRLGRHVDTHGEGLRGEKDLDQRLLEENLDHLLEHRKQATMVDAQALAQERQHTLHLRQLAIFVRERHDGIVEYLINQPLLVVIRDVHLLQRYRVCLALLAAEGEDDDRQIAAVAAHADNLLEVGPAGLAALLQRLLRLDVGCVRGRLKRGQGAVEVVLAEVALLIYHHVDPFAARGKEVVLERDWSLLRVDDVAGLVLYSADPLRELARVRDRGGEEDQAHRVRQQDNGLLPDDTAVTISHVVHLVKHYPSHLTANLRSAVEHGPQDLGGHDHARGVWVDRHISRHQADVLELVLQVAVLLITQGLDGRRVDDSLFVPQCHGDCVFRNHGLTCRRVRRD
mmetsp:Transcript_8957/g.23121  ORF Transcript_8957/g.23121 Transcript_8957/m.23121 type:complete len:409 (-) Transcript_8957:529-1755(-)